MKPYTPQSREYYISKCRYYTGDDISDVPVEDKLLAHYEERWVSFHFNEDDLDALRDVLKGYKAFGLGHFNESSDGVPITLKALLWNRWMRGGDGSETPAGFIQWFQREYLKSPNYIPSPRDYYISKCLFYTGNDDFEIYNYQYRTIAIRERWWVDAHYDEEALNFLREELAQYKAFGLGHFRSEDGIPITLKTTYWVLWCKECEGIGTTDDFKETYQNIIRKYYISKCRYYKGGDEEKMLFDQNDRMLASYERGWVDREVKIHKVVKEDVVRDWLMEGDKKWLQTFSSNDGVPLSLKALLFNRYMHWVGGYNPIEIEREQFKEWYKKEYLKQ